MATGNDSRPRPKIGNTSAADDATITRGMRVCYVGTSADANSDTGLLSELGARVERFDSAEQGFKAVLEKDYDLLLVNLTANTGGLGVPEFVRLVRNCGHPGKVQLPIMAIANQRQLQHAARLQALGADELIGTPIDIAVLHAKIGNLLRKRLDRNPVRNTVSGSKDQPESRHLVRPTPSNGEQNKSYVNASSGSNANQNFVKEVALMKQKFDLPAITPSAHPDFSQGAGEAKGFLERLSNRILGRLAKTAPVSAPAAYKAERLTTNTINAAGENPFAHRSSTSTPTSLGSDNDHTSQVLRGLSRIASPSAENPLAITPPVIHSAIAQKAPPAHHSAKSTNNAGIPSATYPNGSPERPNMKPSAPPRNVPIRQPYVSPIIRLSGARPSKEEKSVANTLRAPVVEAVAPGRLSDAEKSRVYDRVKSIAPTTRRATDLPPAVTSKPTPGRALRICFLEDSCTSSHAIREMLGEEHHEVDHFSSAEEALDAIMEKNYDVVLASQIVALGGLDCVSLIQTIRNATDNVKKNVPIVAITANPDPVNMEPFFVAGANDVLVKPIEGKELNKRLVDTVNARTTQQPLKVNPESKQPEAALKICFLEDSCTSSHAIREMLGEKGHEVDHFSSAEEALDAISEKKYDLVLASQIVALGGMDCEQLVRTIRSGAKGNLPVTVITANPEPDNINKFQRAGASDVILKPVEGSELNERLLRVVQAKSVAKPLTAPPALMKTLHVCFLEDSCTSSHAIREMLGEQGHQVDHFSTPEETLDAFLDIEYDILLVSQISTGGGLDTEGLVRRVRAAGQKKQRPIVLLTTDPSPENQQRFRRAGVNDVIVKPVELNLAHRLLDVVGRRQTSPAAAPAPARIAVPELLHVCFLEDSCTSSHAIREMLSEAGHEVDHFTSAEEALDAFLEKPYDLLLASQIVALGGLDCEGLVKTIRGQSKSAARFSPIVVITANGEPANIESFRRVGADAVIVKPIEGNLSDKLKQVVEEVLNKPASPQLHVVPGAGELTNFATSIATGAKPAKPTKTDTISVPHSTSTTAENPTQPPLSLLESIVGAPAGTAAKKSALGSIEFPRIKLPQMSDVTSASVKAAVARAGFTPERKMIVAMFVVGIIAVVLMNWHHFSDSTPVNVATVERGPIYSSLNAPGMIVSKKKVELTTSVPGQITKVLVKEGDVVSKGDILATLDDRDARIQMQRADANLESARKDVALNERTMDRLSRALQMGAVSRQMAEDAEAAVNAARAKQRVAEEEFRAAQLFTDRLNVTAPFDGVVTANFAVEGLWAAPPGPLFTVVDMNQREIELHLDTADVNRINVGQRVILSSDAFPGSWTEQVVRVAPAASRQGGMANVINVYTTLGPDAPALRYGQQVDGQIRIAANDNALKVPFSALTTRNERAVIGVIENDRLQFVPVKTGIESSTHVEIREGLKAGDQVVLINKELEDGIHVTPVDLHN